MKYSFDDALNNLNLMNECFNDGNSTAKYYHYTSQESFCAMFKEYVEQLDKEELNETESKYVNLFASQIQYLNDKQEYREGVKIVEEESIKTSNLFESVFVTCFCGESDLLSQWKYYGKNCGISIEFDFSEKVILCWYSLIKDNIESEPNPIYWMENRPYNVFYKNHQEEFVRIRGVVKRSIYKDREDEEAANIFVPYCKNKYFVEEQESRLILYPIKSKIFDGAHLLTKIEYRNTKGKIVPHFKCKIAYENETKAKNSIPVKSITIGPGYNQRLVFNSIINMIEPDKLNVKFYSDEEIDDIINKKYALSDTNNFGLLEERVSYRTTNGIVISMSSIPFRE